MFGRFRLFKAGSAPLPWLIAALGAPLVLAFGVVFVQLRAQQQEASLHAADNVAAMLGTRLESTLRRIDAMLRGIDDGHWMPAPPGNGEWRRVGPAKRAEIGESLRALATLQPELATISIFDAEGDIVANSRVALDLNLSDRSWFRMLRAHPDTPLYFSDVLVGRIAHRPVLVIARPLHDAAGRFAGVATASIDLEFFRDGLAELHPGQHSFIVIKRTDTGAFVYGWPERGTEPEPLKREAVSLRVPPAAPALSVVSAVDDVERLMLLRPVGTYPLAIVSAVAPVDFLGSWARTGISAALLLLFGLVSFGLLMRRVGASRNAETHVQRLFTQAIETMAEGMLVVDAQGRIVTANPSAAEILGLPVPTLESGGLRDFGWRLVGEDGVSLPPEESPGLRTLRHGESVLGRTVGLRRDDERVVWLRCNTKPLRDGSGALHGAVVTFQDIGREVLTHSALVDSEARFSSIVATAMDAVITIDDRQRIVLFNHAAERIFGYTAAELIGRPIEVLLPAPARAGHKAQVRAFFGATGGPRQMAPMRMIHGQRKSGELFPIEVSISVIEAAGRHLSTAILRDVSARVEAERQLREAKDTLERRVEERTEQLQRSNAALATVNEELKAFSYSVTHDLRGPLRAIQGFATALEKLLGQVGGEENTARRYLERVMANARRMNTLIDDVLEYTRVTRSEIVRKPVDVDALAAAVVVDLHDRYPTTQVALAPLGEVVADETMLRQILVNLIGNAMKYSARVPAPHVVVGVRGSGPGREFFVRDNGVGFDMAEAGELFGLFRRLHGEGEFEGTGAGLAIVKRLVERHGGTVRAEAARGQGATFCFTLTSMDAAAAG